MKLTPKQKQLMETDYPLISTSDIDWEARCIAVRWVENYEKIGVIEIEQKHKLASDIMNYSRHQLTAKEAELKELREVAEKMVTLLKRYPMEWIAHVEREEALTAYRNLKQK